MDAKTVREWKAGYEALNKVIDEERLQASPQDRFKSLKLIWKRSRYLGFFKPKPIDMELINRWQRLRTAFNASHG